MTGIIYKYGRVCARFAFVTNHLIANTYVNFYSYGLEMVFAVTIFVAYKKYLI